MHVTTVIPEDNAIVTWHMTQVGASGLIANTCGFGVPSSVNALDAVNHAAFAWATIIHNHLHPDLVFVSASMLIRRDGLLEHWDSNVNGNTPGGRSGAAAPSSVAMLVRKVSAFAGKRNRGRFYVDGLSSGVIQGNFLEPVYMGQMQTAFDDFGTALQDDEVTFNAPIQPRILHNDPGAPTEISNFVVESRVATQRGRLRD